MSMQSFDPFQYKAGQRQLWDDAAAGWKKWWPVQEQALQRVSDRLVEMANIQPGHRVLDIGTGIGEPAITAGLRVGSAGHVVAIDQSSQMLAIAVERARDLGLQNLEFLVMDAEALDFPEGSFDSILCRFSLMFLPDLAATLAKIRQMLVHGGRFAASVWDVAPKVPAFSLAYSLAQKKFNLPLPSEGTPSPFGMAEGIAEKAFSKAGFVNVSFEALTGMLELPSAEDFGQFLRDVNVPLIGMISHQPSELQVEYWQELASTVQNYATVDGSICVPGTAICVVGQRQSQRSNSVKMIIERPIFQGK